MVTREGKEGPGSISDDPRNLCFIFPWKFYQGRLFCAPITDICPVRIIAPARPCIHLWLIVVHVWISHKYGISPSMYGLSSCIYVLSSVYARIINHTYLAYHRTCTVYHDTCAVILRTWLSSYFLWRIYRYYWG